MLGAIIGDIVGSRFEFNNNTINYNFDLITDECSYTDDTICTIAIADALLSASTCKGALISWCRKYPQPMGAYGGMFSRWIQSNNPQPYYSFGNGSAMRVSPVAWWYNELELVLSAAELTALPTHDHPEGIKGAKAVAHAIWHFRNGGSMSDFITLANDYYPDFMHYHYTVGKFDETCQGTVPLCYYIITKSTSFENAIRNAVMMGGDSDTICAIVGSIAEAIWGIPQFMADDTLNKLPRDMKDVLIKFSLHAGVNTLL